MEELQPSILLPKQKLYKFVKDSFIDGLVPETMEDFEKSFTNDTTDGSIAFVNEFGKDGEPVMMFFNSFGCAVPISQQKYLKNTSGVFNPLAVVNLKYLELMADVVDSCGYLRSLERVLEQNIGVINSVMQNEVYRINDGIASMPEARHYFEIKLDDVNKEYESYKNLHESVVPKIKNKYEELNSSGDKSEPGNI